MAPISKCIICNEILRHSLAQYCRRCGNLVDRIETHRKPEIAARVKILHDAWDQEAECFRCHYSGIQLEDRDPGDPRYITFDYLIPGKESELVITARIIRDMKYGMSEEQFKTIIIQLAKHFEDGTLVDEAIFKLKQHKG